MEHDTRTEIEIGAHSSQIEYYIEYAKAGILDYLSKNKYAIREEIFESAKTNVPVKLSQWLRSNRVDELSPNAKFGIIKAIKNKRWNEIIDAFLDDIAFGTGGIRGLAAFASREDESELEMLYNDGIHSPILRGPNTINDLVLMLKTTGVAKYAKDNNLNKVVIGYDSRIQGFAFAELITKIFIINNIHVFLFDEPCPYPELTFAIPYLGADFGILISASHNDRRYNGYKLSTKTGAQFEKAERDKIYFRYICNTNFDDIPKLSGIPQDSSHLTFLGGAFPIKGKNYYGKKDRLQNIHEAHRKHIQKFIIDEKMLKAIAPSVYLGFSAYHGAGRLAVPELLKHFNFKNVKVITSLNSIDGRFPCFALEQQPDPGDTIAAEVAVMEFKKEYGENDFKKLDLLVGTDPDADRAGFIIKVPESQKKCYRKINAKTLRLQNALKIALPIYQDRDDYDWHLLDADNAWTLLLWYRLMKESEKNDGVLPAANQKFIALSHTTTDAMVRLVRKYGLGVVKTWVGFAYLANSINMIWQGTDITRLLSEWQEKNAIRGTGNPEKDLNQKIFQGQSHPILFDVIDIDEKRNSNFAALEQSNGFSILGQKPSGKEIWGEGGHVRDKDGTFAAILLAEVQAYAKSLGKSLIQLLDEHIYLDYDVGLFINYYEPEPYWGQFEGPTGMSRKIKLIWNVEKLRTAFENGDGLNFGGNKVLSIETYRTGKYDRLHRWKLYDYLPYYNGFPDEGIRFFFDDARLSHLTARPSGTSQCIRFHVQLKVDKVDTTNLADKKAEYYMLAKNIVNDIREKIGC